MPLRLLALVLSLLLALPTAAGARLHRCGEHFVASCACDHTGPSLESGQDACCSDHSLPSAAPTVLAEAAVAPDALDPAEHTFVPPLEAPQAQALPLEARPATPARGPPKVPIFLRNHSFLI